MTLAMTCGAQAGQKHKNQKESDNASQPVPTLPLPATSQIENDIGEMLGAFQIGNTELMHKHYADNATFVNGDYAPLVFGWQSYVTQYEQARTSFQGMQLNRRNTYIFTEENIAWASYQWEFLSLVNGKSYSAVGQTTLIFKKVGDNWLIVHNHTSQICPVCTSNPQGVGQQNPTSQPPAQNPPTSAPPKP
jgi:ketosteroid isomerase-like protein